MSLETLRSSYLIVVPIFLAVWISAGWAAKKILFIWVKKLTSKTQTNMDDIIVAAAQWPVMLLILISGITTAFHALLPESVARPLLSIVPPILKILSVFSFALFADSLAVGLVVNYSARIEFLKVAQGLIRGVVHFLVFGLGFLIILDSVGVSITPIIASLGIGSLAVALALQPTLENLFAGVQLVIDQPVRPGQFVRLESGEEGYVEKVGWRSTWIRQLPNNTVIIPNSQLVNSRVLNFYYPTKELAVLVEVGVHYSSDLNQVESIAIDVAGRIMKTVPGGVPEFTPVVRFNKFDASSINLTVVLRAQEFVDGILIRHEFIKALSERFNREGIVIPYPITAINMSQEKSALPKIG